MTPDADELLDGASAVTLLRRELPEFAPSIDEHLEDNFGELLFHLVMGDLARFYVSHALEDPELRQRFWNVVDRLAMRGGKYVENAVGVSLVEWFAWGNDRERSMLIEAMPLMSGRVRAVADEFLRSGGDELPSSHKRRPLNCL